MPIVRPVSAGGRAPTPTANALARARRWAAPSSVAVGLQKPVTPLRLARQQEAPGDSEVVPAAEADPEAFAPIRSIHGAPSSTIGDRLIRC